MKLSVIVPCYNVEAYLDGFFACLDKQWGERTDYEVIFVNDGSTDQTQAILQQYVAADTIHRVIVNQKNQGLSAARNAGMKVARGEWITFPDPDDFLVNGGYCLLMSKCLDDNIDVLSFKFQSVNENSKCDTHLHLSTNVIWEGLSYERKGHVTANVWAYLYRKSVVESFGLRFRIQATFGEDALFNATLFSKGVHMRMVDTVCYCYIIRPHSITHTTDFEKLRSNVSGLMYCIEEVLKVKTSDYSVEHWVNLFVMTIFKFILRSDMSVKEVKTLSDRLFELKVFPLTSPWRTERICFRILERPWLLPIVKLGVRVKHLFK